MDSKEKFIQEQIEIGEKMEIAENYDVAVNEREVFEIETPLKFRTRHSRLRIKHKFKEELDRTSQEDAEVYGSNAIYERMLKGEPLPLGAVKDGGQYVEDGIPEGDLTGLMAQNQENIAQYGENMEQVLNDAIQNAITDPENVTTSNDDANQGSDKADTTVSEHEGTEV
jgi:hypothetical protein